MMTKLAALALVATLAAAAPGCGASVESAHRNESFAPVKTYLVGVTEAKPTRPFKVISVSVDKHDTRRSAPGSVSDSVLEAMKAYAGQRGAKMLWVERSMNRWQRRFYGWGLVWVDSPDKATTTEACKHFGFTSALKQAEAATQRCFDRLKQSRPKLMGEVEILFEVDPWGGVRQAAPSPSSSRDTQVHGCAMVAVYRQNYGAPTGFWCRGTLKSTVKQ